MTLTTESAVHKKLLSSSRTLLPSPSQDSVMSVLRLELLRLESPESLTAKVRDFTTAIPQLIDLHPSVKIIIVNVGTNNVMGRQSEKLHQGF